MTGQGQGKRREKKRKKKKEKRKKRKVKKLKFKNRFKKIIKILKMSACRKIFSLSNGKKIFLIHF